MRCNKCREDGKKILVKVVVETSGKARDASTWTVEQLMCLQCLWHETIGVSDIEPTTPKHQIDNNETVRITGGDR